MEEWILQSFSLAVSKSCSLEDMLFQNSVVSLIIRFTVYSLCTHTHTHTHTYWFLHLNCLWKMKVLVAQSCLTLCHSMDFQCFSCPGKNTGVGSHSLLQSIFPTQGSNPGLLHCRQTLYHPSHQGSPIYLLI